MRDLGASPPPRRLDVHAQHRPARRGRAPAATQGDPVAAALLLNPTRHVPSAAFCARQRPAGHVRVRRLSSCLAVKAFYEAVGVNRKEKRAHQHLELELCTLQRVYGARPTRCYKQVRRPGVATYSCVMM